MANVDYQTQSLESMPFKSKQQSWWSVGNENKLLKLAQFGPISYVYLQYIEPLPKDLQWRIQDLIKMDFRISTLKQLAVKLTQWKCTHLTCLYSTMSVDKIAITSSHPLLYKATDCESNSISKSNSISERSSISGCSIDITVWIFKEMHTTTSQYIFMILIRAHTVCVATRPSFSP